MNIELDATWKLLKINGTIKYQLAQTESDILDRLIKNRNVLFSAERLSELFDSTPGSIKSWISAIKKNYPEIAENIETVHGKGYRWINSTNDKEI